MGIRRLLYGGVILVMALWLVGRDISFMRNAFVYDVFLYQCYARAFWQGPQQAIKADSATRACTPFWGAAPRRFRAFPREYPPLALAVFSLPLLIPWLSFDPGFLWWMALILIVATGVLAWRAPPQAAPAFLLYTLLAGWQFVFARYDLVPGLAILLALVLAQRDHKRSATALLAVGTLLKIMPIVLLPVLLITWFRKEGRWRLDCLLVFVAVLAIVLVPVLLLDPHGVWSPLQYALRRPLSIDATAGIVLWTLRGLVGHLQVTFTYGSYNVIGPITHPAMLASTVVMVLGLGVSYWRLWRGYDTLARGFILTLLVIIVTNKVFSPQYILWLLPVVAVTEGLRLRWVIVAALVFAMSGDGGLPFATAQAAPTLTAAHDMAPSTVDAIKVLVCDLTLCALTIRYMLTGVANRRRTLADHGNGLSHPNGTSTPQG